ncbi:hypothetical protein JCM10908_004626 [Rhodotorula pacifica]|uniref:uncharacterized protein n=1 Tax=Rhodotorula pacifica TaxID=1495444 RepID=UPI003181241B
MPAHGGKLPVVKFTVVEAPATAPPDVENPQLAGYGYNDGKEWAAYHEAVNNGDGGRYLRWSQPMEADLAKQVEYDMDEQDKLWLDMVNAERKRESHVPISYEVFEIIMDKIEKEWFDLTRNIPKRTNAMPNEDSKCAICDDGECENSNAIVFCDGCNLAVHQDCYGVPYIPEGQWLCRKCTVSPDKPVLCVLCPNSYGAFKQTTTGQWAHLLCAIWVPETGVVNTVYMEPVDGLEAIPKSRWKLLCYLCKKRVGACIQCANRTCYTAFHVTCAREYGLELKMKQGLAAGGDLKAYCDKHGENATGSRSASPFSGTWRKNKIGPSPGLLKLTLRLPNKGKSARAYKTSFNSGPPVIPAKIFDRIMAYISKLKVAAKKDVVNLVCRYWSLKREARRGAPLLKRIHLEPWTASATSRQQSEQDKAEKLGLIRLLRNDLEKVRMLTELVRKREKKKLERANHLKRVVEALLFPKESAMRKVLHQVKGFDKPAYFAQPVSREQVPDYHDVIKYPMDWATMSGKIDRHEYPTALDFSDDIRLVINNARRYNKPATPIHKAAVKLLESAEPLLADLEALDDRLSDPNVLSHYISQVLTPQTVHELFDFNYDTFDPEGKKALAAAERARKKAEAEAAAEAAAVAEAEAAAEAKLAEEQAAFEVPAKPKGKGKGKGKARQSSQAKEDAMDVDEPVAGPSTAAPASEPQQQRGTKRSAALAGLDSTPVPATRTTRRSLAGTEPPASLPPAKKKVVPAKEATPKPRTERGVSKSAPHPASPAKPMPEVLADEEIDSKTLFTHFESGWVLPAGSRRRRSSTGPGLPPAASAPRKTPRAETAALPDVSEEAIPAMDAPAPAPTPVAGTSKAKAKSKAKAEVPSAGTAKASEDKAATLPANEKGGEAQAEPQAPSEPTPIDKEYAQQDTTRATSPSKVRQPPTKHDKQMVDDWIRRFEQLSPSVAITDPSQVEDGTLVWARQGRDFFYPGEALDPEASDTPEWAKTAARRANEMNKIAVMYFDDDRRGNFTVQSMVRQLGENEAFDKLMLEPISLRAQRRHFHLPEKKMNVSRTLQELKEAYEDAMTVAEDEEDRAAAAEKGTTSSTKRKKQAKKGGKARGRK